MQQLHLSLRRPAAGFVGNVSKNGDTFAGGRGLLFNFTCTRRCLWTHLVHTPVCPWSKKQWSVHIMISSFIHPSSITRSHTYTQWHHARCWLLHWEHIQCVCVWRSCMGNYRFKNIREIISANVFMSKEMHQWASEEHSAFWLETLNVNTAVCLQENSTGFL